MLDRQLLVVSGKGGAGKSAVTAALALVGRRRGLRVLALDMTNGGGLATHLGVTALDFEARPVGEGLHAAAVIRARALTEYLRAQLGIPAVATLGPAARAFDALASTAPAVREVVTMGKVLWEVKRDTWDLVVADGPPTGQIGSYLRAARTIRELVPTGRIVDQVAWMSDILADRSRAGLVLVSLPEELPVLETEEVLAWLDAEKVMGSTVVWANRALPEPPADAPGPNDDLWGATPTPPKGAVGEAAALHRSLWAEQQEWLERLGPDARLPYLFGAHTAAEVAELLADRLEEEL